MWFHARPCKWIAWAKLACSLKRNKWSIDSSNVRHPLHLCVVSVFLIQTPDIDPAFRCFSAFTIWLSEPQTVSAGWWDVRSNDQTLSLTERITQRGYRFSGQYSCIVGWHGPSSRCAWSTQPTRYEEEWWSVMVKYQWQVLRKSSIHHRRMNRIDWCRNFVHMISHILVRPRSIRK